MRAFRVDLATLCLLLSALASKAEDLEGTACQCASNARVGELLRGDDQVQKCKSGYYCECATSKVVKCWLDGFMFSEPDQACLYFDCEEYLSAASTKEPTTEPESTKEPTAEPESTKEPTAEPESTKEPTTEPESTKEPTAEPESTKEPTTVPESTKEPTTVPESTKEPTAESTTAVPSTATTSVAQVDDECACSDSSRSAELLRGDKEVEKCDAGFYCKCGTRLVERCFLGLKFSQQEQQCWYGVDCASDLSPPTTPTPSSSTTRDPSRVCACAAGARDYELVRGPDQVDRCDAGEYCDCNHGVLMNCPFNFTFDEEDQACTYGFDCSAFLNPTSATPARPSESTTALVSLEGGACACSDPGRRAELLRGQDAVALCERGYFCSCASGEITACPGGIPLMPKYDENSDTCSYLFDCEAFLASEAVALTTAVEATTESSTESGAWSTAMSMPSLLLTLVVVALVASVGVVYAVTIYGRNRRLSRPGSGAFLLVPGMRGPNMAAVSRKRSESVRAVLESKA